MRTNNSGPARRLAVSLSLLLLFSSTALADMDDYRVAEGLFRKWGYLDLAVEVAEDLVNDGGQPMEVQASAAFLLADIIKAQANRALRLGKADEHKALLAKWEESVRAAQEAYPESRRALFAELDIVKGLMTRGQQAAGMAADAATEADADAARRESAEAYEEATAMLERIIEDLDAQVAKIQEEEPDSLYDPEHEKYQENGEILQKCDFSHLMQGNAYFEHAQTLDDGDGDKIDLLHKAEDAYMLTYEDHANFFRIETQSLLGWAKAMGLRGVLADDQGTITDALEIFDAATEVEPPRPPEQIKDPVRRAATIGFVLDTKAEAYYWKAKMSLLLGAKKDDASLFEDGVRAVQDFVRDDPEAAGRHFGKLAVLEMGKGLIQAGRPAEGVEAIVELIRQGRQSEDLIPQWGVDPYGVSGAKALSEAYQAQPFAVSAESGFYAGLGFLFREMPREAARALRHGLAAPEVYEEDPDARAVTVQSEDGPLSIPQVRGTRAHWRPYILWELGRSYTVLGEPYSAALAYFQIFADHQGWVRFGNAARTAGNAAEIAIQSLKPLRDAGDEDARRLERQFKEIMASTGGTGLTTQKYYYDTAADLQGKGQFAAAAQEYLRIEPQVEVQGRWIEVSFYGISRVMGAYCKFKAARGSGADPAEAVELLETAMEEARQAHDVQAWAAAVLHLGGLVLVSQADVPTARGLEVLAAFDEHTELGTQGSYAKLARQRQVEGYVAQGDVERAEAALGVLASRFAGTREHITASYVLGGYLSDNAVDAAGYARAAELVLLWWQSEDRAGAALNTVYWVASVLQKGGRNELAAPLFKQVRDAIAGKDPEDMSDDERQILVLARLSEAETLLAAERYGDAVEAYKELAENEEFKDDPAVIKGLAVALLEQYHNDPDARTNAHLIETRDAWGAFYTRVAAAVESAEQAMRTPDRKVLREYWQARATILEIYLLLKEWKMVDRDVRMMELTGELDEDSHPFPDLLRRIKDLRERAIEEGGLR